MFKENESLHYPLCGRHCNCLKALSVFKSSSYSEYVSDIVIKVKKKLHIEVEITYILAAGDI